MSGTEHGELHEHEERDTEDDSTSLTQTIGDGGLNISVAPIVVSGNSISPTGA